MTQLQAYEQAMQTGQIQMRKETARAFAAIARMNNAVEEVHKVFADIYCEDDQKAQDEILSRIYDNYHSLHQEALRLLAECVVYESMSSLEFGGL
jgi:hypothetical protein